MIRYGSILLGRRRLRARSALLGAADALRRQGVKVEQTGPVEAQTKAEAESFADGFNLGLDHAVGALIVAATKLDDAGAEGA